MEIGNCKEIFDLLSDYLDNELPAVTCAEIKNHLDACPDCVRLAESLRNTVNLCRGYSVEEVPSPLKQQVQEQLLDVYQKLMAARSAKGA